MHLAELDVVHDPRPPRFATVVGDLLFLRDCVTFTGAAEAVFDRREGLPWLFSSTSTKWPP